MVGNGEAVTDKEAEAIAALQAAIIDNPESFARMVLANMSEEERKKLGGAIGVAAAGAASLSGEVSMLIEIIGKVKNIATGYADLGDEDLAAAFARFGVNLFKMAEAKQSKLLADTQDVKAKICGGMN